MNADDAAGATTGRSDRGRAQKAPRGSGMLLGLAILVGAGLAFVYPALAAFAMIAFAPTIVARVVETPTERHLAKCVGLLNLAGVAPVCVGFAKLGFSMPSLARLLSDPTPWAAMYGGALTGWGIHLSVATLAVAIAKRNLDRHKHRLERSQRGLIDEWGPEVMTDKG